MNRSKSVPTANRDIYLAFINLKKVTKYLKRAASKHPTSYANILRKRKRVKNKMSFI